MPDIFYLVSKWWKQMLALMILTLAIVTAVLFLQPVKYLSIATALPANAGINDKGSVFNGNIQEVYSSLGSADDLDRMVGTAQLDTIYLAVTDQFNLFDHYKIKDAPEFFREKAAALLKKNSRVMKSEYGELRIKVWDTDKLLAPQLANALLAELESIHRNLQNETNESVLKSLQTSRKKLEISLDSLHANGAIATINHYAAREAIINEELGQYEKLAAQYQLMVDSKPKVLRVVEAARPAALPDRPKPYLVISLAAILALLFSLALALLLERRKKNIA